MRSTMTGYGRATAMSDDHRRIEDAVRAAGTSFFWAMRLLPTEKRHAMYGIYAFCRVVDDIADDPGTVPGKLDQLAEWRQHIDDLYDGRPGRGETRVLASAVRDFQLRREDFLAVIDGMEMDAADRVRIADSAALHLYCDRVACAVGRLSVRVFGVDQPDGDRLAAALGEALQLTNILRDLKEDSERDRLYLPLDALDAPLGIGGGNGGGDPDADALSLLRRPSTPRVCAETAALAERRFGDAAVLLAASDRRRVRPARIMMEVYRRTLGRLRSRGWDRWDEPVAMSSAEKLWVALRHGVV
jgi:presqualene diphosphate synthase